MMKCNKCGNSPKKTDKMAWKCTSCGKAYGIMLSNLQKLQEKKDSNIVASLLKCKECGNSLDDGDEKIFWKCSCGNVQCGKLEEYREKIDNIENCNLLKCPDCGHEVSKRAEKCPNCGCPINNYFQKLEKNNRIFKQKKTFSLLKIFIPIIFLGIVCIAVGVTFYKTYRREVIHDVKWGMTVSQVEEKEIAYSKVKGFFNEKDNYYVVSNVDFYGESVTLMYIFEKEKLSSIWIKPINNSYRTVYKIALEICENKNMPVSFEDNTEDNYAPRSTLQWNIKDTTIELIGNYQNKYAPEYYFSLKPYNGNEYGDKYKNRGTCVVGSRTSFPCRNEITPWSKINEEGEGHCYEHGCYVVGCPNGFASVYDKESLCLEHHFLCE